jgi:hypothetical protein
MSNTFLSSVACLQQFAFNAIGLILDCAVQMDADYIRIAIKKRSKDLLYMDIQFSGIPLTNQEFVSVIANHHNIPARLK